MKFLSLLVYFSHVTAEGDDINESEELGRSKRIAPLVVAGAVGSFGLAVLGITARVVKNGVSRIR